MLFFMTTWATPTQPSTSPDPTVEPAVFTDVQRIRADRAIEYAKSKLGEPYRWEGRGTHRLPDWDCLGILFRAYGKATGRSWWTYEVNPSELVAGGKLGTPVTGLDGVLRADVTPTLLQPGDVLYFLKAGWRIPDAPLHTVDGTDYWPWHTGLYIGDGVVLHAEPGGVVRTQPLSMISWDALFATRIR